MPVLPALIDCRVEAAPRSYTREEVDAQTVAIARGLIGRGLSPGSAIGILAENRAEFVTTYLGIWRAGMVAVPINWRFTPEMIAFVLDDARIALTFCDAKHRAQLPAGARVIDYDDASFGAGPTSSSVELPGVSPDSDATIFYTSGSTGRPKPVAQTHRNHGWVIETRLAHYAPERSQHVLIAAPLFHTHAFYTSLFYLACGSTPVLLPRFDPGRYLAAMQEYRCEMISGVPAMFAMLLRDPNLARADRAGVRTIRMGGSPISPRLWDEVTRAFPNAQITNVYGATEIGPLVFGVPTGGTPAPPRSVGWPVPGVDVRLVGDDGNDADEGTLWARTPAASARYRDAEGWTLTGDRFRRDASGAYHYIGRADDAFDCAGVVVFPGNVEAVLEEHPYVAEAAVIGVADEIKGHVPVAFVVSRSGAHLSEDELKQFSLERAPAYQHPRRILIVDALPLTGSNKIDKLALHERYRNRSHT